ncbi:hypothetical protein HDU98_012147 [Podochytrium sp. JEL0797]|nr:hypothetical protein HDU98_012147 [Podochytrium sp. JEL0797]
MTSPERVDTHDAKERLSHQTPAAYPADAQPAQHAGADTIDPFSDHEGLFTPPDALTESIIADLDAVNIFPVASNLSRFPNAKVFLLTNKHLTNIAFSGILEAYKEAQVPPVVGLEVLEAEEGTPVAIKLVFTLDLILLIEVSPKDAIEATADPAYFFFRTGGYQKLPKHVHRLPVALSGLLESEHIHKLNSRLLESLRFCPDDARFTLFLNGQLTCIHFMRVDALWNEANGVVVSQEGLQQRNVKEEHLKRQVGVCRAKLDQIRQQQHQQQQQ